MKLTEKYSLCDSCSKTVEHLEENVMVKFLYFPSKRVLVEYERFKSNILYIENFKVSHLFEILKGTNEKYLCKECIENLYKNAFPVHFPIFYLKEKISFPFFFDSIEKPVLYDKIEILGFETNGRIEFAETKNNKLAEVYFTPINIQIKEMLEKNE